MRVKFKHKVEKAKGACLHPKNVISQSWFRIAVYGWQSKASEPCLFKAWVAVGLGDGSVEVWDYVQAQKRLSWRAHAGPGAS